MTIPELRPYIVGAGGVASYFLPVLVKTFPITQLWLRDADKLEERNLDRQHFHPDQIGQFKAEALIKNLAGARYFKGSEKPHTRAWIPDCTWFAEGELPPVEADLIICCADNHTARRACLEAARNSMIPCLIGANEYYDSQALWVEPDDYGTPYDPYQRYPEMATDDSDNPIRCTGDAQVAHPQLAMANFRCASHMLDLLWLHKVSLPDIPEQLAETKREFPFEIYTSINENKYSRYNEEVKTA